MKVHIHCFGPAKDIIGNRRIELELSGQTTAGALKQHLLHTWPYFQTLDSLRLAVNESYVNDEHTIGEGDEVAIIPPVSGG